MKTLLLSTLVLLSTSSFGETAPVAQQVITIHDIFVSRLCKAPVEKLEDAIAAVATLSSQSQTYRQIAETQTESVVEIGKKTQGLFLPLESANPAQALKRVFPDIETENQARALLADLNSFFEEISWRTVFLRQTLRNFGRRTDEAVQAFHPPRLNGKEMSDLSKKVAQELHEYLISKAPADQFQQPGCN